ncbi:MAG: hypothetical protein PUF50_01740 [Erysipelotrichaceae bacterium]|nr:hypothetical protein [Erysipelotrichaceae bacterium]
MKKLIYLVLTTLLFLSSITCISANNSITNKYIEETFDDGSYIEIVIEETNPLTRDATTKTGKKTANYKDSNGNILWSFYVSGIFKYDGETATCTYSVVNASSYSDYWKIDSKSASKTNATANGSCTAKMYTLGICTKTVTKSLSLTCSPDGTLS